MGRKKIVIKHLEEDRNRNVTFLKRKAGLMKKAWELSVLCGADVSVIIFSQSGKLFEFSSSELDDAIQRYHEYAGPVERRRAEEFAALMANGNDSGDEDNLKDEDLGEGGDNFTRGSSGDRDGSNQKGRQSIGGQDNGAQGSGSNGPPMSLKGKQGWKEAHSFSGLRRPSTSSSGPQSGSALSNSPNRQAPSASKRKFEMADDGACAPNATYGHDGRGTDGGLSPRARRRSGGGPQDALSHLVGMAPAPRMPYVENGRQVYLPSSDIPHRQSLNAIYPGASNPSRGSPSTLEQNVANIETQTNRRPAKADQTSGGVEGFSATSYESLMAPFLLPDGSGIDWARASAAAQLQTAMQAQQAQLAYLKDQQSQQEHWMRSMGLYPGADPSMQNPDPNLLNLNPNPNANARIAQPNPNGASQGGEFHNVGSQAATLPPYAYPQQPENGFHHSATNLDSAHARGPSLNRGRGR